MDIQVLLLSVIKITGCNKILTSGNTSLFNLMAQPNIGIVVLNIDKGIVLHKSILNDMLELYPLIKYIRGDHFLKPGRDREFPLVFFVNSFR
jgi:hypothetical protein